MPIGPGTRVGPYEITAAIGAGGMGEVYRARDTRLGRDVAIKVLPESFASDPDRRARFEREAQLLASLNHPNIAIIHGLEESAGVRALVMELVEGPTLADRIAEGPIPLEEALPLARQIAEALEAAHERGIIHRDLKPANIKLTPSGQVKVLDFGLAKMLESAGSRQRAAGSEHLSMSPTLSVQATYAGVILGTAAYMSPEQARGKAVDRRADIWAFGCVLFEMLTGKQAFDAGETVSDAVAAILKSDPDWDAVPADTPANIRTLLRRCLKKDPRERLRDIGDARLEIAEPAAPQAAVIGASSGRQPLLKRAWRLQALSAFTAAAITLAITLVLRSPTDHGAHPPMTFAITLPSAHPMDVAQGGVRINMAISSDGSRLAYIGIDGQTTRMFLRSLDQIDFKPLPGTEGAQNPTFSPDGSWVAFIAGAKLMKVPVLGGSPVVIADLPNAGGGGLTWNADDTILFQRGFTLGIAKVAASGGTPTLLVAPDTARHENAVIWPQLLPGGVRLLFTVSPDSIASFDDAQVVAQPIDKAAERVVLAGGMGARYLPTGHVVFAHHESLLAARLDRSQRTLTGPATPVVDGVMTNIATGSVEAAIAVDAGTLAYVPAVQPPRPDALVLVDRTGHAEVLKDVETFYVMELAASPDGRRVAVRVSKANDDIHVYDFSSGTFSRVTFEGGDEQAPVWTPDSRRLAYLSQHGHAGNMFWKFPDGSGIGEQILNSENVQAPSSFSPDGKLLAYTESDEETGYDIWVVDVEGAHTRKPFARTAFQERRPAFSPDGRWLAYESNESGETQVYVARYPDASGKAQVSVDGGGEAIWAGSNELFYRNGDKLMAVDIKTSPALIVGRPRMMFEGTFKAAAASMNGRSFAPLPDGRHFVMARAGSSSDPPHEIRVVLNWYDELKRLVPTK